MYERVLFQRHPGKIQARLFLGITFVFLVFSQTVHAADRPRQMKVPANPVTLGDQMRTGTPDLKALASRIRDKYSKAKYISFSAEVPVHESLGPGFTVLPGRGIKPQSVFEVVMSNKGDIRVDLKVNGEDVYSYQVAVKMQRHREGGEPGKKFFVREIDHVNAQMTRVRVLESLPESMSGASSVLDYPSWCAYGGYLKTHIGQGGKVPDSYSNQIDDGILTASVDVNSHRVLIVKFIKRDATIGPDGAVIPGSPSIYDLMAVDPVSELFLGKETQVRFPGQDPVTIRVVKFRDIEFPTQLDDDRMFSLIPEKAKNYALRASESPGAGEEIESNKSQGAAEK